MNKQNSKFIGTESILIVVGWDGRVKEMGKGGRKLKGTNWSLPDSHGDIE